MILNHGHGHGYNLYIYNNITNIIFKLEHLTEMKISNTETDAKYLC